MNLDEMKKLYETGDYICVRRFNSRHSNESLKDKWFISENPAWSGTAVDSLESKLIHKKYKDVLDAYLANNKVEIEYSEDRCFWWGKCNDFITSYYEHYEYRLKLKHNIVTDFTNTYCEANEPHKSKLEEIGLRQWAGWSNNDKFYIDDPSDREFVPLNEDVAINGLYKQIHYNTDINEWVYMEEKIEGNSTWLNNVVKLHKDTEEKGDRMTNKEFRIALDMSLSKDKVKLCLDYIKELENGSCVSPNCNSNSVYTCNDALNNFEDFGFTADFEGKIYEEVEDIYFGRVWNDKDKKWKPKRWNLDGSVLGAREPSFYDLAPIKKEWYEDKSNFPAWIIETNGDINTIERIYSGTGADYYSKNCETEYNGAYYRLATKEEVLSLYYKGKEEC